MVTRRGAPCSPVITCSDASLEGGGICSASALSDKGSRALAQWRTQSYMNGLDKVVLVEVSSGIGGGRRAYDWAALHVACYIALGASRSATAVIESTGPESINLETLRGQLHEQQIAFANMLAVQPTLW
jgi:hypothetical protein